MDYLQLALMQFNTDIPNWYKWIDTSNGMVYSNVELNDDTAVMPTEEEVNAKIAELQVIESRRIAYGSVQDQLDMQYWDSVNGTTTWKDAIAAVKTENPKP